MSGAGAARTVGFIGIGAMGAPMAGRLADAGRDVIIRDLSVARCAAFRTAHRAREIADPSGFAAACDAVITMLPTGATVRAALVESGIAAHLRPETLVIDMSSAAPWETQALAAEMAPRRLRLLDAPVSGGVARARAGTLAIMVGGAEADVAAARPLLAPLGEAAHAGPLGAGQAVKALNNMLSAVGLIASVEVMLAAAKFGLDPARTLEILNRSTGRNNATENKIAQFILSRRFDSAFALDLMVKDVGTAARLAEAAGAPAPLGAAAGEMLARGAEALGPGADHTAIAEWLEARAGIILEARDAPAPRAPETPSG